MIGDPRRRQSIHQLSRGQIKSIFRNLEYLDDGRATPESVLAGLTPRERAFVEHWRAVIERSEVEVAKLFVQRVPEALRRMDYDGVEAWLLAALDRLDQRGLGWAVAVLNDVERFAQRRAEQGRALALSEVAPVLSRLCIGLGGRELRIAESGETCTDTETLFLPAELRSGDRDRDFRCYKAMAVHHWAQTVFGTWRPEVVERLLAQPERTLTAFAVLERRRLDACVARWLPGMHRLMQSLGRMDNAMGEWSAAIAALQSPQATAMDSLHWAGRLHDADPPAPAPYHGVFNPRQVQARLAARLKQEREQLRLRLGQLMQQLEEEQDDGGIEQPQPRHRKPIEGYTLTGQSGAAGRVVVQLAFQDRAINVPDDVRQLLSSIQQDLGRIPEDYLDGIGRRLYDAEQTGGEADPRAMISSDRTAAALLRYPEWDYTRQRFRPDYCVLRELPGEAADPVFVADTLRKYHGLVKSIRRSFEALLGESRIERRQPEGEDIDLDALVEARVEIHHGDEPSHGVHTRLRDTSRSIAVLFMVDMSGSTKGWINEAERESLVLLCEALETIGDRYAIYGFSGRTHQRVEVYRIKRFEERYTMDVRARIAGIRPRAYTRLGAPLRHLGALLARVPVRHRLLVTLSDGKPEDYGSYYGRYGIEDTRHALLELRRAGVHPYCITIDREGGDYLPYMYGPANYAVIDQVAKLPLKVADIYRKLTS